MQNRYFFSKFVFLIFIFGHQSFVAAIWEEYFDYAIFENFTNLHEREKALNFMKDMDKLAPFIHTMANKLIAGEGENKHEKPSAVALIGGNNENEGHNQFYEHDKHLKAMANVFARITLAYNLSEKTEFAKIYTKMLADLLAAEKFLNKKVDENKNSIGKNELILANVVDNHYKNGVHHSIDQKENAEYKNSLKKLCQDAAKSMQLLAKTDLNKNGEHQNIYHSKVHSPHISFDAIQPFPMENFFDYWKMVEMAGKMLMANFKMEENINEGKREEEENANHKEGRNWAEEEKEREELLRLLKTLTMGPEYFDSALPNNENGAQRRRRRRKRDLGADLKLAMIILAIIIALCLFGLWWTCGFKLPGKKAAGGGGGGDAAPAPPAPPVK